MVRLLRGTSIVGALVFTFALQPITSASAANAHPLHTSLAQVTIDSRRRSVEVTLKVFLDDLTKAAAGAGVPVASYAVNSFAIVDGSGAKVPLKSCGEKRVGDLVWLCFNGPLGRSPKSIGMSSRVLFDLYADQINVVQATIDGTRSSLLFTRGDGVKRIQ